MKVRAPFRVLCTSGMAAEAQIARWAGFAAIVGPRQPARYDVLLDRLGQYRPTCLVSFGLAGGLAPSLGAGDILVSTEVIAPHRRWQGTPAFRARAHGLARALRASEGAIYSSPTIIASIDEKASRWRETGALAVDMESAAVAMAAEAAGIPFMVMRAVADPAASGLPSAAWASFSAEEGVLCLSFLAELLTRPRQIPAVCAAALQAWRGLVSLSVAARMLALAFPPLI